MEMIPAFTDVLHVANITQDAQVGLLIVLENDRFLFRFSIVFKNDRFVFGKTIVFKNDRTSLENLIFRIRIQNKNF